MTPSESASPASRQSVIWPRLALLSSFALGALLVFSAFTKLLSPKAFVSAVETYNLLPGNLVLPATTVIVGLELMVGVLLILGIARRTAAWICLPMVVLFIGMILHAMRLGLEACGCFGEVISMTPSQELILDIVMLALVGAVLRWGEDIKIASPLVAPTLGWGVLCLGAAVFLAGGPAATSSVELDLTRADLSVLAESEPALDLPSEAFLFFFSADCDHCWSYAGGVQMMNDRVEGIEVHGITFSDAMALDAYREAFAPTYPIHVLDYKKFSTLLTEYPAAIWIQDGEIAQSWSGLIPSHREIVEVGGYAYKSASQLPGANSDTGSSLFGGTVSGRH